MAKQIRYVGYTSGMLYYRLSQHCSESRQYSENYTGPKGPWIKGLIANGLLPFIRAIAGFATREQAKAYEKAMITRLAANRLLYNREQGRNARKNK